MFCFPFYLQRHLQRLAGVGIGVIVALVKSFCFDRLGSSIKSW